MFVQRQVEVHSHARAQVVRLRLPKQWSARDYLLGEGQREMMAEDRRLMANLQRVESEAARIETDQLEAQEQVGAVSTCGGGGCRCGMILLVSSACKASHPSSLPPNPSPPTPFNLTQQLQLAKQAFLAARSRARRLAERSEGIGAELEDIRARHAFHQRRMKELRDQLALSKQLVVKVGGFGGRGSERISE